MSRDKRYWDANAFLGYLADEADRAAVCEHVLAAAEKGQLIIVTSALTIAEVLWVKNKPKLPRDKRNEIEKFFKHEYISVQNVTRKIADLARDVVWDHNIKPKDAIHVATALLLKLPLFETYDEGLIAISGKVGDPLLKIAIPHVSHQPDMLEAAGIESKQKD